MYNGSTFNQIQYNGQDVAATIPPITTTFDKAKAVVMIDIAKQDVNAG